MPKENGVCVICLAYKHEKYIKDTLEGFVKQKTNFPVKVIVHDDASPDGTAEIIREYEKNYPHIFHGIYQTENQYSKRNGAIIRAILPLIDKKYVTFCEGDDYWTDENKLQKQYDAMESHPECYMSVHKVQEVDEVGTPTERCYPLQPVNEGVLTQETFMRLCEIYNFQTSSYFLRADEYLELRKSPPECFESTGVIDQCLLLYFGNLGPVYYIDSTMSCYRRGVATSWSTANRNVNMSDSYIRNIQNMMEMLKGFDTFSNGKFKVSIDRRISKYMFSELVLTNKSRLFLKKENRRYFKALPVKRKLITTFSMIMPDMAKKIFSEHLS